MSNIERVDNVEKKITKRDLNMVFLRMQLFNITNNFETMQAVSFCASLVPVLNRLYKDKPKEQKIEAMQRHLQFYNSNVISTGLILGVTAAVEETTAEEEKDTVVL